MLRCTRYTADWVLPIAAPPIRDGAVLVGADGRIEAVGPAAHVPFPDGAIVHEFGEAALLPGLVNAHAHPELTALRGRLEDLPFHDWIATLLEIRRGAALTLDDDRVAARWHCVESLAAGITTIAATEASGAAFDVLRESGQRGIVYHEVFGPDPDHATSALAELRTRVDARRALETDLVRAGVSPHAPFTVSDDLFRRVAAWARAERLPMAVHAAESEAERKLVTMGEGPFGERLRARGIRTAPRGRSTIALLDALGALDARPLLIHCVTVDADDIRRIAATGATVAHCPTANARLGHGIAPLTDLLEAGVSVGLGTDSVASNNRLDILEEARLAQLQQRARIHDATALPAADLLRMATLDGARALGLAARIGSLEPGKDADLCALSLAGAHVRPVHDPAAAVIHAARASDIVFVSVRGRALVDGGVIRMIDVPRARADLDALAQRLRATSARTQPVPS
ncbi:MAG: amidohydrolase family protein [Gemmatimonadetes bacterium]|nr:amidohydrolase family protein [Gemmatimonadota bacterium]